MKAKIINPISVALLVAISGCNAADLSDSAMNGTPGTKGEGVAQERLASGRQCSGVNSNVVVGRCLRSQPLQKVEAVTRTLEKWSIAQVFWDESLLESESVARRYALSVAQKTCLKEALCKEMGNEGL